MADPKASDTKPVHYLDDMQVGQRFTSGTYLVDEAQIIAFAKQFDPQPFHTDPEAAKNSFFEGLVASGWHTAAITGGGGEISWPKPTRPGSILHVESEVLELKQSKSRPDRGMAIIRNETKNQAGEVVQVMTA